MKYKSEYEKELDLCLKNPEVMSKNTEAEIQETLYTFWINKEADELQSEAEASCNEKQLDDLKQYIKEMFALTQTERNRVYQIFIKKHKILKNANDKI